MWIEGLPIWYVLTSNLHADDIPESPVTFMVVLLSDIGVFVFVIETSM